MAIQRSKNTWQYKEVKKTWQYKEVKKHGNTTK